MEVLFFGKDGARFHPTKMTKTKIEFGAMKLGSKTEQTKGRKNDDIYYFICLLVLFKSTKNARESILIPKQGNKMSKLVRRTRTRFLEIYFWESTYIASNCIVPPCTVPVPYSKQK